MKVNLSILEEYGRVAVHCSSKKQAYLFMEAMWEQHPEKVDGVWERGNTNWFDGTRDIYYLPRIFHSVDESEYKHCQSSNLAWVNAKGYSIVEFEALLCTPDFGEFDTSEVDIKCLFDIEPQFDEVRVW